MSLSAVHLLKGPHGSQLEPGWPGCHGGQAEFVIVSDQGDVFQRQATRALDGLFVVMDENVAHETLDRRSREADVGPALEFPIVALPPAIRPWGFCRLWE